MNKEPQECYQWNLWGKPDVHQFKVYSLFNLKLGVQNLDSPAGSTSKQGIQDWLNLHVQKRTDKSQRLTLRNIQ